MAYAALVSLSNLIGQILNPAGKYYYLHDVKKFQALDERVNLLQAFLEVNSQSSIEDLSHLEEKIRGAANEAEDIIESYMLDHPSWPQKQNKEKITELFQRLDSVTDNMDSVMQMAAKLEIKDTEQSKPLPAEESTPSLGGESIMVGFDDQFEEILDRLTGQLSRLEVVPIVGAGGCGKTTLARNVYESPQAAHRFDTCAWVTVSQKYLARDILLGLLSDLGALAIEDNDFLSDPPSESAIQLTSTEKGQPSHARVPRRTTNEGQPSHARLPPRRGRIKDEIFRDFHTTITEQGQRIQSLLDKRAIRMFGGSRIPTTGQGRPIRMFGGSRIPTTGQGQQSDARGPFPAALENQASNEELGENLYKNLKGIPTTGQAQPSDARGPFPPALENQASNEELGENLYKNLKGKRYLIAMDDVWDIHIWDIVKRYFPDDNNGSRILLTSRQNNVADYVNHFGLHHNIRLLSIDESWRLFCYKVFGDDSCSPELEKIGKRIVKSCGGLPLAIVVIAGLLSKADMTRDFWEHVAENVSSFATENHEQLLEILLLSYNYLPQHLKACFLYMGLLPEDHEIHVSRLIKLWVSERFLKASKYKSSEKVAEECLDGLIGRNLLLVPKHGSKTKRKTCSIHNLLRELCIRIGQDEKFLYVIDGRKSHPAFLDIDGNPRLATHHYLREYSDHDILGLARVPLKCLSRARSFLCPTRSGFPGWRPVTCPSFQMLRVFDASESDLIWIPQDILELANLRYLAFVTSSSDIPSSISQLSNLQTLIVYKSGSSKSIQLPSEIWNMPQLRHVQFKEGLLPNPGEKVFLFRNLEELSGVKNLRCSENIVKGIPNLKKLKLYYDSTSLVFEPSSYHLHNLVHLHHIKTLALSFSSDLNHVNIARSMSFPQTLEKLTLNRCMIPWEDMTVIGSLPNLQALKLQYHACQGPDWQPIEGEFSRLEFLLLEGLDIVQWQAESDHFPSLRHLVLRWCYQLGEIPSAIGEILTLETIELVQCSSSAAASVKEVEEEQRESGNDMLRVKVKT